MKPTEEQITNESQRRYNWEQIHEQFRFIEGCEWTIEQVSDMFTMNFIKWYSGMEEPQIKAAFERYKKEQSCEQ